MNWRSEIKVVNAGIIMALLVFLSAGFLSRGVFQNEAEFIGTQVSAELALLYGLLGGAALVSIPFLVLRNKGVNDAGADGQNVCFNQTLSSLIEGVIRTDARGSVIYMNEVASKILNRDCEEALGKPVDTLLDNFCMPGEKPLSLRLNMFKEPEVPMGQSPLLLRSNKGGRIWIELKSVILKDKAEKTIGAVLVFSDMTDKKKTEEINTRDKELLEAIVENIPSTIFIKDAIDLKYLRVNKAGEKLMGDSRNNLLGKNDHDLFSQEQAAFITTKDLEVFHKGFMIDIPAQAIQTNKGERWIHTRKIPIFDENGVPAFLLGISEDITERRELEAQINRINEGLEQTITERTEELVLQRKFTENIINNIPTDVAVLDPLQNYLFVNPKAIGNAETREWIIGKNDFDYCKLKGTDEITARNRKVLFDKAVQIRSSVEWVDEHTGKQGEKKYVLRKFHPIFVDDQLMNVIGYGLDITDLKRAEEVRKDYIQALEEMMFITSHKVRQPVSQIMAISVLLESEISSQEELDSIIGFMKESVENLDSFTRELTKFIQDLREKSGQDAITETDFLLAK